MQAVPQWACALGSSLFTASIRSSAADFVVTEELSIDFSDDGEHDFLWIEKTGANTHWVAERLADHAGVPARDVGYAGLKDRHAITRQWFSVRRPGPHESIWSSFAAEGVCILESRRHRRKLRRGAHQGNAFRIALRGRDTATLRETIATRLHEIIDGGVPNYFGAQRFGHGGANIQLCRSLFSGRRLSRPQRSIALSAARSLIFNEIVDSRVRQGSWNTILPGELANLDGSGSVFAVDDVSADLTKRCAIQDIHPSATLWGDGAPQGAHAVADLEQCAADKYPDIAAGLIQARVEASTRPVRLRVQNLNWEIDDDVLWLEFSLRRGGYATTVLREIVEVHEHQL